MLDLICSITLVFVGRSHALQLLILGVAQIADVVVSPLGGTLRLVVRSWWSFSAWRPGHSIWSIHLGAKDYLGLLVACLLCLLLALALVVEFILDVTGHIDELLVVVWLEGLGWEDQLKVAMVLILICLSLPLFLLL